MQMDQVQVLVQQAAAGNVDAFVTLIQAHGHELRLALAAHLEQPAAVAPVEIAVWSAVRQRLGEWLNDTPFPTWVQQIAVDVVASHLDQADRRAIDIQDVLTHQIIEHCRAALADGQELGVIGLGSLVQALPETTKHFLVRRYRERQRTAAIATALLISEAEVASALMAARAACDWRQIARPPAPGDRLLPPLIEDWLSGTIDVDSRSLLATNLGRDFDKAAQFARQVRVHVALGALLTPFGRDEAVTLVRQTGLGSMDSSRVMMGEPMRSASGPRSAGSDVNRPPRMTTSNRQVVPVFDTTPRSSSLPWILGGGMVLIGVIALVATSVGSRPAKVVRNEPPVAVAPTASPTSPTSPTSISSAPSAAQASGGVLRLEPGRASTAGQRPATPPVVSLVVASAGGKVCRDEPLEVRASLSHIVGVKAVEFYLGDQQLGVVDVAPYLWTWDPPKPGPVTFSARVLGPDGVLTTSSPISIEVLPPLGAGGLRREWWTGVSGGLVADGKLAPGFPDRPQGFEEIGRFAAPHGTGDHYLQRLRGYVVPPLDGEYVFMIAADDEAQLWLSEDDTRARLRQIAMAPRWDDGGIGVEDWNRDARQRSSPIHLRRGQRYYVEVLHKEHDGDDHVEVGWRLPHGIVQAPIPGRHLSPAHDPVLPTTGTIAADPVAVPSGAVPPVAAPPLAAVSASASTAQLVRSIDFVSTGPGYVIGDARNGELVCVDRDWRLANLPAHLATGRLIRTRNNDDKATANPHLRFTVDVPVDIYLAIPVSGTSLPTWMQGWAPADIRIKCEPGVDYRLYRASFPAGQVVLGANERANTGATDNYFVLVLPAQKPPAPVVWKPLLAINLGGEAVEAEGLRFKGHRQAEIEGQTPAGTNQPGPWLSDLPWVRATSGHNQVLRNRSIDGKPLTVAGKTYERGIGTHAFSEIIYDLAGRYTGLTALVGIDDEAVDIADVSFQVFGDGQKLFDSGSMRRGSFKPVAVPLTGVKELKLVVDPNGDVDWDHADWINPQLLRSGGNDGLLMVRTGRRAVSTFSPRPAVDPKLRGVFGTALVGTKDGLSFAVRVPNGPSRVFLFIGEPGAANSHQFDLTVEGVTLAGVGLLPADGWAKLGPVDVTVSDGTIDVSATAIKGIPLVMGIVVEQPAAAPASAP